MHAIIPRRRPVALPAVAILTLMIAGAARAQSVTWGQAMAQSAEWYATAEAVRIADNLLVYQHPNGGWGKNVDMARPLDSAERARVRTESRTVETLIDNGGRFLDAVIAFLLVAFALFMVVRAMNRMRKAEEPAVTTKPCPQCKMEVPLDAVKCGHCTSQIA